MKNLTRLASIGVVAVVILTVASIFILLSEPNRTASGSIVFTSGQPTDIEFVHVRNISGEFKFYFDFEEDGYVLDDIPPYTIDIELFYDFMANSANLSAIRKIDIGDFEHQRLMLVDPVAEVDITLFDGSTVSITFSGIEHISGNYYAIVSGFDGIYLIHRKVAEPFLLPKTQIISRFVTPPLAISSPLSAIRDITFTGSSLEHPVTIKAITGGSDDTQLAALSFGGATHIVKGAGVYQLDQTYGVQIFGSLFGIEAVAIQGYNLSDDEITAYGFDTPFLSIDYGMVNGVDSDLRYFQLCVVEAENGLFYAKIEGRNVIYTISHEAFIDIEFERLPSRWFLTPLIMDLSAVTIAAPNQQHRFEINNTDPLNPIITHDGQVLDTTLFRSFFRLITSAAHDDTYLGLLPPPDSNSQPLVEITYEYTHPNKTPDILVLYRSDARRANVFVNGIGEFAMKDLFAERVLAGCTNLIEGIQIEENW